MEVVHLGEVPFSSRLATKVVVRRKRRHGTVSLQDEETPPAYTQLPGTRLGRGRQQEHVPIATPILAVSIPVTNGHLDVVRQAVTLCDRLVVAIGVHPGKKPLFSTEERLDMVRAVFEPIAETGRVRFRLHHL